MNEVKIQWKGTGGAMWENFVGTSCQRFPVRDCISEANSPLVGNYGFVAIVPPKEINYFHTMKILTHSQHCSALTLSFVIMGCELLEKLYHR
jgi:hypothetical protein